jgi:hypothetical protein
VIGGDYNVIGQGIREEVGGRDDSDLPAVIEELEAAPTLGPMLPGGNCPSLR